jgi:two-component system, LytTR family, response regulator
MKRMLTALLIDDDVQARNILEKYLEFEEKVKVVASLDDTLQAVEIILKYKPDIIFLDINMPHENGLQFASRLTASNIETLLVFTTAFQNYAFEAFPLKPFDFLIKPFGINEISSLLHRVEKLIIKNENGTDLKLINGNAEKLKFKTNRGYVFLVPDEIIFIRSVRNYCKFYLISGEFEKVIMPISEIYSEISQANFIKLNRSEIINMEYIVRIDRKMKKCIVGFNKIEFQFSLTQKNLDFFENFNAIKLG